MYARIVNMRLKKNAQDEFTKTFENEIMPMLRKQTGFQDELSFIAPERSEVTGISLWNKKESADEYNHTILSGSIKTSVQSDRWYPRSENF